MEALIPQLFILTAEASVVLLLILIIVFIFNIKAKRKDMNAVNELIQEYTGSKEERISSLKKQLQNISFKGDLDAQAEKLFQNEKKVIKEFVTLYLRHDTYRLLDYSENLMDSHNEFLKTSGSGQAAVVTEAAEIPVIDTEVSDNVRSEETANATMLAREQAESNEAHLKELSELRLKNTELNEHLFEALETITGLMTEHGKKTGQEVESNAQKLLEAIIYLRDKRLEHDTDPGKLAPPADDGHDKVVSFDLNSVDDNSISVDLADNDDTLDDSTAVNLGINDELNMDLDTLDESESQSTRAATAADVTETVAINLDDDSASEADPWADALAEQASDEAVQAETPEPEAPVAAAEEADPWADALAEQAATEADEAAQGSATKTPEESDPWADALAEQATAESEQTTEAAEETDPWADALAEQASSESSTEEADPWAEALAEQEKSENK